MTDVGFETSRKVKLRTIDCKTLKTFLSPLFFSILDFSLCPAVPDQPKSFKKLRSELSVEDDR